MKEQLFPELLKAHLLLIEGYEQALKGKLYSFACPLCKIVDLIEETPDRNDHPDCTQCTYQEDGGCIIGLKGQDRDQIQNHYFSGYLFLTQLFTQTIFDESSTLKSAIEAKVKLHKTFVDIYVLWDSKKIDALETALKLSEVYNEYKTKYL